MPEGAESKNDNIRAWSLPKAEKAEFIIGDKPPSHKYFRTKKVVKDQRTGGTGTTTIKSAANIWYNPGSRKFKGGEIVDKFSGPSVVFLRGIPKYAIAQAYEDVQGKIHGWAKWAKFAEEADENNLIPVRVAMPRKDVEALLVAYRFANASLLGRDNARRLASQWVDEFGYTSALLDDPSKDNDRLAHLRERFLAEVDELEAEKQHEDDVHDEKADLRFMDEYIKVSKNLRHNVVVVDRDNNQLVKDGVRQMAAHRHLAEQISKVRNKKDSVIDISPLPGARASIRRHTGKRPNFKTLVPVGPFEFTDEKGDTYEIENLLYVSHAHTNKQGKALGGEPAVKAALLELGIAVDSGSGKALVKDTVQRAKSKFEAGRVASEARKRSKEEKAINIRLAESASEGEETEGEEGEETEEEEGFRRSKNGRPAAEESGSEEEEEAEGEEGQGEGEEEEFNQSESGSEAEEED